MLSVSDLGYRRSKLVHSEHSHGLRIDHCVHDQAFAMDCIVQSAGLGNQQLFLFVKALCCHPHRRAGWLGASSSLFSCFVCISLIPLCPPCC